MDAPVHRFYGGVALDERASRPPYRGMDITDPDVIIAGAGMAGATLALALAQGGLKPLLVDPAPFETQLAPTFDGRASAIAYAAFRQWRALGLADALAPHAQRIEQILVTDGPTASPWAICWKTVRSGRCCPRR